MCEHVEAPWSLGTGPTFHLSSLAVFSCIAQASSAEVCVVVVRWGGSCKRSVPREMACQVATVPAFAIWQRSRNAVTHQFRWTFTEDSALAAMAKRFAGTEAKGL